MTFSENTTVNHWLMQHLLPNLVSKMTYTLYLVSLESTTASVTVVDTNENDSNSYCYTKKLENSQESNTIS